MPIDIGQLLSFMVQGYSDWNKTSQTAGMITKNPATSATQQPLSDWQRILSAMTAGNQAQPQIQFPSAQRRQGGLSPNSLLPPQQSGGGGDMMSGISSIMSILALLGI